MKNMKLNALENQSLNNKEMNATRGGCGCACAYANNGGSSTGANNSANAAGGLNSPGIRLFVFFLFVASACANNQMPTDTTVTLHPNRLYFCVDSSMGRGIIIPLQINDSTTANLIFDTGTGTDILLDSAFCAANNLTPDTHYEKKMNPYPLAGLNFEVLTSEYYTNLPVKMGETDVYYHKFYIQRLPWNKDSKINGYFTIPQTDTTHVWELNFENSYIEVHDLNRFQMPEGCLLVPLAGTKTHYYFIQIPLQILCGADTLRSNYTYMIDTGNPYVEILWLSPVPEMGVLSKQEDFKLYTYMGFSSFQNTVKAILWDSIPADTLKTHLYTVSPEHYKGFHNIGLNFLKRFNVFFDLRNRQIGLLPIEYKRLKAPHEGATYFFVDTIPTSQGNYKINYIPDFKDNYYKKAGLALNDEIVSYNGYPYRDVFQQKIKIDDIISLSDTLIFDIIRNGQPIKIVVPIPENKRKKK
ncbi:MAG: TIGR04149 family rSAM-modified RiPP [Prevotellaceae bacterium]|jgi:natural product precursor|nr:TIGR04149 family rSAM-modified RiPP [Prevotellaceae bacterium]